MSGYIKLYRTILTDLSEGKYKKPLCELSAWICLLLLADYKEGKRGVINTTQESLATLFGWKRSKVIRFLKRTINEQKMILKTNNNRTIITIVKYDLFQGNGIQTEQLSDNKRTINEHIIRRKKKEERNIYTDSFERFWKKLSFRGKSSKMEAFNEYKKYDAKTQSTLAGLVNIYTNSIEDKQYHKHICRVLKYRAWEGIEMPKIMPRIDLLKEIAAKIKLGVRSTSFGPQEAQECLDKNLITKKEYDKW